MEIVKNNMQHLPCNRAKHVASSDVRTSSFLPSLSLTRPGPPTRQRPSVGGCDAAHVVHPSKQSQHGGVGGGVLVLGPSPASPHGRAPVGGLGLLGGVEVVEVAAVGACADGAVQTHGALARLLGLALARPHPQAWRIRSQTGVRWVSVGRKKVSK